MNNQRSKLPVAIYLMVALSLVATIAVFETYQNRQARVFFEGFSESRLERAKQVCVSDYIALGYSQEDARRRCDELAKGN